MAEIIKKDESVLTENEKALLWRTLGKLEQFFPEHKVFALDALCSQQRENSAKLAKKLGYDSVSDFLSVYGFESIKGAEVYEIRKNCGSKPGAEPFLIKERVDNSINSLNEYYPDRIIEGTFNREHSNLFSKLTGLYQWLGYKSLEDMLAAYGFTYSAKRGRSKSVDPEAIIQELKKRYPEGTTLTAGEIKDANPDLKIKSVMNLSKELFGMTFANYLVEQGVIIGKKRKTAEEIAAESKASYAELLKEYDELIQREFLGWKPLPKNADELLETRCRSISRVKYRNALKAQSVDEETHFRNLGVIADNNTDNELRSLISFKGFMNIIGKLGLTKPTATISQSRLSVSPDTEKRHIIRPEDNKANINRTNSASSEQIDWIMTIIESELGRKVSPDDPDIEQGLKNLPPELREVAILRLLHPESNLTDIGEMLASPVGKAAVYKRFEKIHNLVLAIQNK